MSPELQKRNSFSKIAILKDRAAMLAKARSFFQERHVIEVDCPILTAGASIDAHIDLIPACFNKKETRYLHSSPEYGMKRLISEEIGDIYQLSHVFRDSEHSPKHNPEFTMAEWYRLRIPFREMIEETVDFIRLFIGQLPFSTVSYRELFQKFCGFDYVKMSEKDLVQFLEKRHVPAYPSAIEEGKDALLNLILGTQIEPHLGKEELTVLAYYPSSQAALAKTQLHKDEKVAERFEIYYKGVELANGYHELTDATEQRKRFEESNQERLKLGKEALPLDESFLKALKRDLPDFCGVAVGFDRLMMLRHHKSNIAEVIPFGWDEA
jgi:elongation factor P--(R)-beta-lysine ligase